MVPKITMYIRKKAIRNKKTGAVYHYAYAVESRWRKKGARQKVKHYLGKVHTFPLIEEKDFFVFAGVEEGKKEEFLKGALAKQLIRRLFEWELSKHKVEGFSIDWEAGSVRKEGKPASIEMNEGMLNTYTLQRLLRFKVERSEEEVGYALAKAFVEAGVKVPQEAFIAVFGKVVEHR